MKFHKGSKKMKGEDEDLFTAAALVVAFIVSFNTLPCAVKQPQHVKASETAFFFQPPWLHPLPLTNVLGSQGATVLLNGPFLFPNPKAQAVAEVALPPPPPPPPTPSISPYYGIELHLTFVKNNGWRPFIFPAFSVLRRQTSLLFVFTVVC